MKSLGKVLIQNKSDRVVWRYPHKICQVASIKCVLTLSHQLLYYVAHSVV